MKNLLNKISLDRIDELPLRQQLRYRMNTKFNLKTNWISHRYKNDAKNRLYRKIELVIHSSVGKYWNDVYSKLSKMIKHLPYYFDKSDVYQFIESLCWDYKKEEWTICEKWYAGKPKSTLKNFIKNHSTKYYRATTRYYINEQGVICIIKPKPKSPLTRSDIRYYAEKQKVRKSNRKKDRKLRKQEGINELQFINNPKLLEFYRTLVIKRKNLLIDIHKTADVTPTIKSNMVWWRYYEKQRIIRAEKAKKEIIPVEKDLENLRNGNLDVFFQSNIYLYSQQKECHHFAQP